MSVMPLIAVPEGGDVLDILAARYRTAFEKVQGVRAKWLEGTLEFAAVILEARERIPAHREYSRWITRNQLEHLSPNDRRALMAIGEMHRKNPSVAHKLLTNNFGKAWRVIWEKKANVRNVAPIIRDKGDISSSRSLHGSSGSRQRKRRAAIPTVMREDYVPGTREHAAPQRRRRQTTQIDPPHARLERKGVILKALTPEQVDPEFVGTPLEFATKYGHVNLQTKQQIEHHKNQEELMAWLAAVSDFEKSACALNARSPEQDTLRKWLAKPGKAAKLGAWLTTIENTWRVIAPCLDLVRSEKKS